MCYDAGFRVIDMNFCSSIRNPEVTLARDNWESLIYDIKNEGERLGISFSQSHAPYNAVIFVKNRQPTEEYMRNFHEMTRRSIIASGMLGIKWMTVHPLNDSINTEYDVEIIHKTNLEFFAPQLELCKKHGVGLSIENMFESEAKAFKRCYCSSPDDLIELIDAFGDESVGATWDFGHASQVIKDQPAALRRLGKRLKSTHVQDNYGKADSHMIPFVGGNIDWESIMPCLCEIGYEGDFVYECHSFMNDIPAELKMQAAKLSFEFGMYCMSLATK